MDFTTALAKIRKDEPSAGDVHVASTSWKPPRRRSKMTKGDEGLYVHRPLTNAKDLHTWAQGAGIPNLVPPDDMHATIVYSRAPAEMEPETNPVTVNGGKRKIGALGDKGAVVLHFESPELQAQHQDASMAGASHDFPAFQPHVTLTYDAGGMDLSKISPPDFPLEFGGEVHAPLNVSWAEDKGLRKFEFKMPVTKTAVVKDSAGADRNLVFGWASIIEKDGKTVVDVQDDTISESDLETAFYGFMKDARNAGEMHEEYGSDIGAAIECMVFTKEKQAIMKIDLGFVGAWVGFEVSPRVFAKVKSGDYPAFSIGGEGVRLKVA